MTGFAQVRDDLPEIGSYAALDAYAGSLTAFYVRGVSNIFDGGHGVFRLNDADTTSAASGVCRVDALGRRWGREFSGAVNVLWFGAKGDGVSDDTPAFVAALAAADTVFAPDGAYKITSTISVAQRKRLIGSGYRSNLVASGIVGAAISITSGNGPTEVGGFRISGAATVGVAVDNAQLLSVHDISLDGLTATNGFVFVSTWGSTFSNLFTNGATIANACFICGQDFNANDCRNWYTSNRCAYNILLDATYNGGSGVSHGSCFSMMTAQSGEYGLYVRAYQTASFSGLYVEDCVFPLRLGDQANGRLARAISINGGDLDGPSSEHPQYANREAVVWFDYAIGCAIGGVNLVGAYDIGNTAPVTISGGGGLGAIAVARVTADGAVHSVEVINPGSGYTTDPSATVGGAGSGATLTVTRSGATVGSIAVSAGGAGYVPQDKCPVAITYHTAFKCSIGGAMFNSGYGDRSPIYPWLVRRSSANSGAGVSLLDDQTFRGMSDGAACEVKKSHGYGYAHAVISYTNAGALNAYVYTPPQFP